jgi:hypothetical protein
MMSFAPSTAHPYEMNAQAKTVLENKRYRGSIITASDKINPLHI